jgi:outer membrane protein TolC
LQPSVEPVEVELPSANLVSRGDRHPIDLATAMRLAGASNVQIALAMERVCESQARLKGARALWLPTVHVGAGYNHHDGKIQDTSGDVLDVSRSSVYAGGGISTLPITGGSNGPPRLFAFVSLTDALFEPLAARQVVRAAESARNSTFNDVLFQVSVAYLELSRSQTLLAIGLESVQNAEEFLRLTEAQQAADVGLPADVARARDELGLRRRQVLTAHERIGVASAELARLLRLDPSVMLVAVDERPVPIELVNPVSPLCDLISQGMTRRPERAVAAANARGAYERKRMEELRPLLPSVQVGYSSGGFAGGVGSFVGDYGSRGDFDIFAVWQLRNMGVGNVALREDFASRYRQATIAEAGVGDQVAAEISAYYHRVRSRREQIEVSRQRVAATAQALPLNFRGIKGRQLRAIEAQQAIDAWNAASTDYLDAIIQYNQAQLGLLRAIGGPPASDSVACDPCCP